MAFFDDFHALAEPKTYKYARWSINLRVSVKMIVANCSAARKKRLGRSTLVPGARIDDEESSLTLMDRDPGDTGGISARSYRALMRHQAGAVAIVATQAGNVRAGLTATAFSSLSDQPPMLLVCVQRKAGAHDLMVQSKVFSVNILAADQQAVAVRFSGNSGVRGDERFEGQAWGRLKTGAPVLDHALAALDCELIESHRFTTHTIFIGRVVDGITRSEAEPLLYFRGDYWNLGER